MRTAALVLLLVATPLASVASTPAHAAFAEATALRLVATRSQAPQRFAPSLELFERAVTQAPESSEYRLAWAETLSWAERYDDAIAQYREVQQRDPESIEAVAGEARVRSWRGEWDEAARLYETMTDLWPRRPEGWLGLGEVAAVRGDFEAARDAYEKASLQAPEDPRVLEHRAEIELWTGHHRQAARLAQRTLEVDPHNAKAHELRRIARLGAFPYRLTLGYAGSLVEAQPSWHTGLLGLSVDVASNSTVHAQVERVSRFGLSHWQTKLGVVWEVAPRLGVFAHGSFTPDAVFLPSWSATSGIYYGITTDTYVAMQAEQLAFPGHALTLLQPSVSQKLPLNLNLRLIGYLSIDRAADVTGAGALELSWRPVPVIEAAVGFSAGQEALRFIDPDGVTHDRQRVVRIPVRVKWTFLDTDDLQLAYSHERWAGDWVVNSVQLLTSIRF